MIGGIGSVPGAMVGGLILGFAESYSAGYSTRPHRRLPHRPGSERDRLVIFVILIAFMIFRPQGLLGRADIKKV